MNGDYSQGYARSVRHPQETGLTGSYASTYSSSVIVASGVMRVKFETMYQTQSVRVPMPRTVSVPAVLTGVHVGDNVMERLEQDGLVSGVGQPRVGESLCVQGGIDADASARSDSLRSEASSL